MIDAEGCTGKLKCVLYVNESEKLPIKGEKSVPTIWREIFLASRQLKNQNQLRYFFMIYRLPVRVSLGIIRFQDTESIILARKLDHSRNVCANPFTLEVIPNHSFSTEIKVKKKTKLFDPSSNFDSCNVWFYWCHCIALR